MPGFQKLSNAIIALVSDGSFFKVNDMVMRPCMARSSRTFSRRFNIPYVFFLVWYFMILLAREKS